MRGGRPGLIGLAARTAVVTGTANAMNARAAERQQAHAAAAREAYAAEAAAPSAAAPSVSLAEELTKLSELHAAGVLTDEEMATAKARLLA